MGRWRDDMRHITKEARSHLHGVSAKGLIMWEQIYIKRMIEIEAADGNYTAHFDALWQINVQWLRDEGFTVLGDDDTGYDVSWGRNYRWE